MTMLWKLISEKSGATAIEYGLLAALMSVAIITGLGTFTDALNSVFGTINNNLKPK